MRPGADLARVAVELDGELLVVDAPDGVLEDARLTRLLQDAPCDVAVLVPGAPGDEPVLVAFAGAEHDWPPSSSARGSAAGRALRCTWSAPW